MCRPRPPPPGGIYNYKDGRTAPDTIDVLLEYPAEFTATFEGTLVPGITGEGVEFCGTRAVCSSTAGTTSSIRWAATRSPRW